MLVVKPGHDSGGGVSQLPCINTPAARFASGFCIIAVPLKLRAQGAPGAQRTRSLAYEGRKYAS